MQVDVKHRLSRICIAIHDNTVALFGNSFLSCYVTGRRIQATDQRLVLFGDVVNRRDVLPRDYQDMCRRLRVDVAKRDGRAGLVNNISRYFPGNYFAKKAVIPRIRHCYTP